MTNNRTITELYQALKPLLLRDFGAQVVARGGSGSGMEAHALSGPFHTGTLAETQAPWAATKNEWATALASHAALPDVHHAAVTAGTLVSVTGQQVSVANGTAEYQIAMTGATLAPGWVALANIVGTALNATGGRVNVDGSIAGAGLVWSGGSYTYATIAQRGTATSAAGAGTPASYETITQRGTTTNAAGAGTSGGYNTIAQRGAATSANSYTNSLSVTRPTGVVSGDVMVAVVTWWVQTLTAPSGWTQIGDTLSWSHPDGTVYARAYYRVAGGSEPSSYAWGLNASNDIACTIVAYSNVDNSTPIGASGGQTQTSASMTAPSITPATTADMLLFLGAVGDNDAGGRTATPPSGMTELADTTSAGTWIKSYAAQELLASGSATGTRTATVSASARNAAFLVSLRPTSTPGGNTSVAVSAPSSVATDDVMLATVAYAGGTLTPPSGWTQILSRAGTGVTLAVYRRIATGSEPGSYTWSLDSTDGLAVAVSAYDNVDTTSPVGAYASQANSSSTSMVAPTITPATSADMLYFAGGVAGNVRATVPSGMTEEADAGATGVGVYGADQLLSSSSATGTRTATLASATANAAALVSLRPVAVEEVDTSVSVGLPTGVTTDDVLVAVVAFAGGTLTPPSGWTQVLSQAYTGGTLRVYRKTATGSEPSTYTWALDSSAALAVATAAYDGVDLTTPVDVSASQANASSTSMTGPAVTTTLDTCLLLLAGGVAGNVRATAPGGMAEEADAGATGVGVYLADQALSASGSTGTRTATLASAAANGAALVALRPAVESSGGGGVINVQVSGLGLSVGDDTVTLTSSSNPGAAASVLASDESGYVTLVRLSTSDRVRAPLIDTAAGNLTVQPSGDVMLDPAGGEVRLAANRALQSDNYASQTTGMRVTYAGEGDFRYLFTDELHAKAMIADLEQALAGGQIIAKSVAVLASTFTAPAAGGTATLVVRDLPSAPNMACFQANDIVLLRTFSRAGGSLSITNCWGVVTGYVDGSGASEGTQTWTFTRSAAPNAGAMAEGATVAPDALVLDYGVSGNGFAETNAIDGAYGINSPYTQIVSWTGHPATGQTVRTRLGNLRGVFNVDNEYGLYAGAGTATSDAYLRISNTEVGLYNLPLRMYTGGTERIHIAAHNDVWIGPSSADKRLTWDGSTLTVRGAIVIQAGSSGIGTFTDAGALATQSGVVWSTQVSGAGKPADNATVGADWSSNLSGRPTELTDGRISTAISSTGIVQSRIDPGVAWGANPGVGVAGLLLGSDYMGFWTGTAWRTYMDNAGRFYVNAGAGSNYLSWDGTTLTVSGAINVVSGNAATQTYANSAASSAQTAAAGYTDTQVAGRATTDLSNSVISTLITGANIRVGSGTKDSNLSGWNIDVSEIVAQASGADQVVLSASTGIGLLATNTEPTAPDMKSIDWVTAFPAASGNLVAQIRAYYDSWNQISVGARNLSTTRGARSRFGNFLDGTFSAGIRVTTSYTGGVWGHTVDVYGVVSFADNISTSGNASVVGNLTVSGTVGSSWTSLTPAGNWANFGTPNATLGYKTLGSLVSVKGVVQAGGAISAGAAISNTALPAPAATRSQPCSANKGSANTTLRVYIGTDGILRTADSFASGDWISVEFFYFTGG